MRLASDSAVVVPPPFTHPLRQLCGTDTAVVVVPPPFTHPFRQVCGEDCLCHNQHGRVRVAFRIPKPGARILDRIGRNQKHVAVASSMPDARTDVPVSLPPPVSDTCIDILNDQVQALEINSQKLVNGLVPDHMLNDHGVTSPCTPTTRRSQPAVETPEAVMAKECTDYAAEKAKSTVTQLRPMG